MLYHAGVHDPMHEIIAISTRGLTCRVIAVGCCSMQCWFLCPSCRVASIQEDDRWINCNRRYILVKSAVIESITFKSCMLCDSSDTSRNVYLRKMFITLIGCSVSQGYYLRATTIKTVAMPVKYDIL